MQRIIKKKKKKVLVVFSCRFSCQNLVFDILGYRVIYDALAQTHLFAGVCFVGSTCFPPASEEAARYESSVCWVSLQEADVYSSSRCALRFTLCNTQVRVVSVYVCVLQVADVNMMSKVRGRQRKYRLCLFLSLSLFLHISLTHTSFSLFPLEDV